ncbi:MAG: glycosyltransferase [Anaerolineae bacterium]|nr:glycosyltransferase [Anaerolineae bacterium]
MSPVLADVTVVLPTKNEAHNIVLFLQSLPVDIALVVVDASEDDTVALIAEHRPRHTRIIHSPARIAEARQIGATSAQTEWVLFTDADITFAPDYFEYLQGFGGDCDVIYGTKRSRDGYACYYRWFSRGQGLAHRLGIPAASGSNLLIRREVLLACGGFDLRLMVNEDSEIAWRIKRQGYRVCFAPELIVYERDHRRLRRGAARKTLHSLARCLLLYLNLMPDRWRSADWGYWSKIEKT